MEKKSNNSTYNRFQKILLTMPKRKAINDMINNSLIKFPKQPIKRNLPKKQPIKRNLPKKQPIKRNLPKKQPIKKKYLNFSIIPSYLDLKYKSIKLPTSIYTTNNNEDIISLNNGKYLIMEDKCFVYRNSIKKYYNYKLSLNVSSKDNTLQYYICNGNKQYNEIMYKKCILNVYQIFQVLSKYPLLNHPIKLTFNISSVTFYILCHIDNNNFILDFSNNKSSFSDEIRMKLSSYLDDYKIYASLDDKKMLKMVDWQINIYNNLIQLSFEKDNKVILSGEIFKGYFESVQGTCDFCIREEVL